LRPGLWLQVPILLETRRGLAHYTSACLQGAQPWQRANALNRAVAMIAIMARLLSVTVYALAKHVAHALMRAAFTIM